MVPTAQYPRSRYIAMQVTLFVILLGTIALAKWVSDRDTISLTNGPTTTLGSFTIHMPSGWKVGHSQSPTLVKITAINPSDNGQHLTVLYQQLNGEISPMNYLLENGLVGGPVSGSQMKLDGYPGVYVESARVLVVGPRRVLIKDMLACVVLPSNEVLTVQLTGPGRVDERDEQLMRDFLSDIEIKRPTVAPRQEPSHERSQPPGQQWESI